MSHPGFGVECNNLRNYGKWPKRTLEKLGVKVGSLPHKTTFLLLYVKAKTFTQLKSAIRSVVDPRRGGAFGPGGFGVLRQNLESEFKPNISA